jgi:hypothetical protein
MQDKKSFSRSSTPLPLNNQKKDSIVPKDKSDSQSMANTNYTKNLEF